MKTTKILTVCIGILLTTFTAYAQKATLKPLSITQQKALIKEFGSDYDITISKDGSQVSMIPKSKAEFSRINVAVTKAGGTVSAATFMINVSGQNIVYKNGSMLDDVLSKSRVDRMNTILKTNVRQVAIR